MTSEGEPKAFIDQEQHNVFESEASKEISSERRLAIQKVLSEMKILSRVIPATAASALTVATFGPVMIAAGKLLNQPLSNRVTSWIQQHTWSIPTLKMIGVDLEIDGLENISKGGQIIASNHQGLLDNLALPAALAKRNVGMSFVFKKELSKIPIFGAAIESLGVPGIDRKKTSEAKNTLSDVGKRIKEHKLNVIWYPEGTRSLDGNIKPFKKGFAYMAVDSGQPIVPTCIKGSLDLMKKGDYFPRPGIIQVQFGEPIDSSEMNIDELTSLTEEKVKEMMAEMKGV